MLLTANVAFLAIPSVDTSTPAGPVVNVGISRGNRTPAQVTSFMSVVFSLGCLAIVQLLLRHHMARPQDSAEEVVSPISCVGPGLRTLVNDFKRISIYATIMTQIGVWKRWRYYTVFPIPCFSGRESTRHGYNLFALGHLTSLSDRIVSFFGAFVLVALVDSEGQWQRYPTAAVMLVFIGLLIWCIWTTWERGDTATSMPNSGGRSHPQLEKDQPEQHDGQRTPLFQSVHVDPILRSN